MEAVLQNKALEMIHALQWTEKVDMDGSATMGPGLVIQTEATTLELDGENRIVLHGDIVDILMAFDEACLQGMLLVHADLFPRSVDMTPRDVESMFIPCVKRPLKRSVALGLAEDMLALGPNGEDMSVEDFLKHVRNEDARAELIIELAGFSVDAYTFTPIVTISEAALLEAPPPPKRLTRLKKHSKPITPVRA